MKSTILFSLIWLVSLCVLGFLPPSGHNGEADGVEVEYLENYDGDTFKAEIAAWPKIIGHRVPIRIAGVDTAEMASGEPCERRMAIKAKTWLRSLLKGASEIRILNIRRGKYFRIVADVYADRASVSQLLLDQGFATRYAGKKKKSIDWCSPIQAF
ncbi:thermonuclease family protein [Oligoflexaceae bacterium]|nr:thermonuclease family protein [Oligoflexaceae bacterium]